MKKRGKKKRINRRKMKYLRSDSKLFQLFRRQPRGNLLERSEESRTGNENARNFHERREKEGRRQRVVRKKTRLFALDRQEIDAKFDACVEIFLSLKRYDIPYRSYRYSRITRRAGRDSGETIIFPGENKLAQTSPWKWFSVRKSRRGNHGSDNP